MACRDYEYDYENWLGRSRERLAWLAARLGELHDHVRRQGRAVPPPIAEWLTKAPPDRTMTREQFDGTVQMLCLLCQTAEDQALTLPASVQAWWQEHKARDEQEELARGLSPTPVYADFWQEHAAKLESVAEFPGVDHLDAVRALEEAGYRVVHEGKHITVDRDGQRFLLPRQDPVNPFAMAAIIRRAGLTDEQFRALLERSKTRRET